MAVKNSVRALPIAAANSAGLDAVNWTAITPAGGLAQSCFMLVFKNFSDENIEISYDGTNPHDAVLADKVYKLLFQANAQPGGKIANIPAGTKIYIRGTAGVGTIYLGGYYQEEL